MKVSKQTDPSAIVVPFGKHKGATVAELLVKDAEYADWIMAQGWVAERFAELHAALATRGAGTDDTPEHNALQARFLDEDVRAATLRLCRADLLIKTRRLTVESHNWELRDQIYRAARSVNAARDQQIWANRVSRADRPEITQERETAAAAVAKASEDANRLESLWESLPLDVCHLATSVTFEQRGVDVVLAWAWKTENERRETAGGVSIELKPSLGDDFPTVMRQMKRTGTDLLVVGTYNGRGVSEPQLRQMFKASGLDLIFVQEIEEEMRRSPGQ